MTFGKEFSTFAAPVPFFVQVYPGQQVHGLNASEPFFIGITVNNGIEGDFYAGFPCCIDVKGRISGHGFPAPGGRSGLKNVAYLKRVVAGIFTVFVGFVVFVGGVVILVDGCWVRAGVKVGVTLATWTGPDILMVCLAAITLLASWLSPIVLSGSAIAPR
jgi:hypothetical protein